MSPTALAVSSEIELRFVIRPSDFAHLARAPRFQGLEVDDAVRQRISSVYYDTEKLLLAKAGWTLRVRKVDGRFIQTVKSEAKGALGTERGEYECDLDNPTPDIGRVPDPEVRDTLAGLAAGKKLVKVLSSDVTRTTRMLKTAGTDEIELALDKGKIRTLIKRNAVLPVCSLELELKHGTQPALFEAARFLASEAELVIDVESKSQKGLRAIAGETGNTHKAGRIELPPGATAEQAYAASITHCLRHIARNTPAVAYSDDAEGVHQLRVGLRRLRVALAAAGKPFRTAPIELLRDKAKAFAATLSETRDFDVFAKDVVAPVEKAIGKPRFKALHNALASARKKSMKRASAAARSEEFLRFLIDLAAAIQMQTWRTGATREDNAYFTQPARDMAAAVLGKRLKQACKSARHLEKLDDQERHRLRLTLKKIRYTAEFFGPLFALDSVSPYLSELSKLQDQFGALNDAANAGEILTRIAPHVRRKDAKAFDKARETVCEWHRRRMPHIWSKAKKRWKHFAKTKPFWD